MMKKNLGVNACLNIVRQCLSFLFPLITYPYASRVLGADGIGKVSYGQSIISYFVLIALLGVSNYMVREGAKRRDRKKEIELLASQVFSINMCTTILSYVILLIILLFVHKLKDYRLLIILQSLSIVFTTLGVEWINTIYEDFLFITIRSIVTHCVSLALMFILVQSPEDYYKYALLTVVTNGIICFSNITYCRRYIHIKPTIHMNIKKHMKPLITFFSISLAGTIYMNLDTTMLGWMKGDYSVGLYSISVKVYTTIKAIMIAAFTVTIPRLSYYIGNQRMNDYKELYSNLWCYMTLILLPAGIGLACTSDVIIEFMGGAGFIAATTSLKILAGALMMAIYAGLVTACLNVCISREKDNLVATIISALLNVGLNFIAIPLAAQNGAAITTLISELFVFVFCFLRIPNKEQYLHKSKILKSILHAGSGSVGILFVSIIIKKMVTNGIVATILTVIVSVILYCIILLAYKDEQFMVIMKKIKKKL